MRLESTSPVERTRARNPQMDGKGHGHVFSTHKHTSAPIASWLHTSKWKQHKYTAALTSWTVGSDQLLGFRRRWIETAAQTISHHKEEKRARTTQFHNQLQSRTRQGQHTQVPPPLPFFGADSKNHTPATFVVVIRHGNRGKTPVPVCGCFCFCLCGKRERSPSLFMRSLHRTILLCLCVLFADLSHSPVQFSFIAFFN